MSPEAASPPTVGAALADFRQANGLAADEHLNASWSCDLGGVTLRLPNFAWRRRAILAHDLHHLLTGYPCTLRGECDMAAWEFGAGRMPHWAASLFCLPLILWGLIWAPRPLWRAFLNGRRSRSLHERRDLDQAIASPLSDLRREVVVAATGGGSSSDRACFMLLLLRASSVVLSPLVIPLGLWLVLTTA